MRLFILTSTLILTACGQGDGKVTFQDSDGNERSANVSDDGNTRTVTSDDGLVQATGTRGGANARFPAYAPQYPGASVQAAVDMNVGGTSTGGMKQHIITMQTPDAPEKVIAFYQERAQAAGKPHAVKKTQTGPILTIGSSNPLDMEGMITAMPVGSGGTSVNVSVNERISAGQ